MTQNPYLDLLSFVQADTQVATLKHTCATLDKSRTQLSTEMAANAAAHTSVVQAHRNLKKQFDSLELDIRSLKDRRDKITRTRDNTQSPKEYLSLTHELEVINEKIDHTEDQLINLLSQVEEAEKEAKKSQTQHDAYVAQHAHKLQDLETKHVQCVAHQREVEQLVQERRKQVKPDWLTEYDAMKARVSNPMVTITNGVCDGCFQEVAKQDCISLDRHELIRCRSCYRFLYNAL